VPRDTRDLVALMVVGTACLTLVLAGAGVALVALVSPGADLSGEVSAIGHALSVLVAASVGYLAGKGRADG
jgi:hypothetical protein